MSRNVTTKEVRTLQARELDNYRRAREEHAVGLVAQFGTARTQGKKGIVIKLKRYTEMGLKGLWSHMPHSLDLIL